MKLYIYPQAKAHVHDVKEIAEYRNLVPLSQDGIRAHCQIVSREDADYYYMGQFHFDETLQTGWTIDRFEHFAECPEKHIADIEGDWDYVHMDPRFWQCGILTMNGGELAFAGRKNLYIRPTFSRLLVSMRDRQDKFPLKENQIRFGFRGQVSHPVRQTVAEACWNAPGRLLDNQDCILTDRWHAKSSLHDPNVRDYEKFMIEHGLALCPRGRGTESIRLFEACFYGRVIVLIGENLMPGYDRFDTSFVYRLSHNSSIPQIQAFLEKILDEPFTILKEKAAASRNYFDRVLRPYLLDPTRHFLSWTGR